MERPGLLDRSTDNLQALPRIRDFEVVSFARPVTADLAQKAVDEPLPEFGRGG